VSRGPAASGKATPPITSPFRLTKRNLAELAG
jgi:hypothetical protein